MLASRIVTALVLLAVCVGALLFLPNAWWGLLLLPVLGAAALEWCRLTGLSRGGRTAFVAIVLLSAGVLWLVMSGRLPVAGSAASLEMLVYASSAMFWVLFALPCVVLRWELRSKPWLVAAGWLLLVPCWLALVRLQVEPLQLLALLVVVWLSDSAAFFAGKRWCRHRLAPSVSPGKTWEGVAGAAAAVAVYYVALSGAAPGWTGWSGWRGALLLAVVAVAGVVGDLFESWVKRQAGVKDSGALLPGHGGILDRIDSMTAALPIAALLLRYGV